MSPEQSSCRTQASTDEDTGAVSPVKPACSVDTGAILSDDGVSANDVPTVDNAKQDRLRVAPPISAIRCYAILS